VVLVIVFTNQHTWERGILRKCYGPVCRQGVLRNRNNQEVKEFCRTPDLIGDTVKDGVVQPAKTFSYARR
jgi:hypothetical protein